MYHVLFLDVTLNEQTTGICTWKHSDCFPLTAHHPLNLIVTKQVTLQDIVDNVIWNGFAIYEQAVRVCEMDQATPSSTLNYILRSTNKLKLSILSTQFRIKTVRNWKLHLLWQVFDCELHISILIKLCFLLYIWDCVASAATDNLHKGSEWYMSVM